MTNGYFSRCTCWMAMVAVWTVAEVAHAAIVTTYPDLSFLSRRKAWKNVVAPSSFALQGTVELEYRTDEKNGCLWSLTDENHDAEYMIALRNGAIVASFWFRDRGYVFNQALTPGAGVNGWHSVRLSWRQGSNTLFTVDGLVRSVANSTPLQTFAIDERYHQFGDNNYQFHRPFPFFGVMHNVVVRDTYKILDPPMRGMWAAMVLGLLAYAWRKSKPPVNDNLANS